MRAITAWLGFCGAPARTKKKASPQPAATVPRHDSLPTTTNRPRYRATTKRSGPRAPLRKRLQFRLVAFRQRVTVDVQHHRNETVIAHNTRQVDCATLAELVHHSLEGSIGHLSCFKNFAAEV